MLSLWCTGPLPQHARSLTAARGSSSCRGCRGLFTGSTGCTEPPSRDRMDPHPLDDGFSAAGPPGKYRKTVLITSCVTILHHSSSLQTARFCFFFPSYLIISELGNGLKVSEGLDGKQVLTQSIYNFSSHSSRALPI